MTNTDDPTVDRLRGDAPPLAWPVEPMYQYPLKVMRLRARIAEQSEPDTRRVIQRGWRSGLPSVYHRLELERDRVRDACRVTSGLPPEIVRQFMRLDLLQHTCRVEFGAAQHWRPTRQQYAPARILGVPLRKGDPWWGPLDVWDHPEFFCDGNGLVAAVVHLYSEIALDAVPAGVVVDRLPVSWYYPQRCWAYVLRRVGSTPIPAPSRGRVARERRRSTRPRHASAHFTR